jgi:2OG-Fe(II) oxygenase superfamily
MLLEANKLNASCIEKLARNEILAVLVKGFVEPGVAADLTEKILSRGYTHYTNAPSIGRIGMAFYEAEGNPSQVTTYFEQAEKNLTDLRDRCAPLMCPIDLLRCALDETWPAGAMLETLYGKKMYVGLSRVVEPGVTFLAHHDIFAKDAPDSFHARSLQAQIACNVYLSMPTDGGGLQIWANEIAATEFDTLRKDSYGISPEYLGQPQLNIRPEPGDLILFNSRLMHSVTPGKETPRLSLSCFIGYRGPAAPLSFWS